jgi:hypothetical protein
MLIVVHVLLGASRGLLRIFAMCCGTFFVDAVAASGCCLCVVNRITAAWRGVATLLARGNMGQRGAPAPFLLSSYCRLLSLLAAL